MPVVTSIVIPKQITVPGARVPPYSAFVPEGTTLPMRTDWRESQYGYTFAVADQVELVVKSQQALAEYLNEKIDRVRYGDWPIWGEINGEQVVVRVCPWQGQETDFGVSAPGADHNDPLAQITTFYFKRKWSRTPTGLEQRSDFNWIRELSR